jgi:hypothetical protein
MIQSERWAAVERARAGYSAELARRAQELQQNLPESVQQAAERISSTTKAYLTQKTAWALNLQQAVQTECGKAPPKGVDIGSDLTAKVIPAASDAEIVAWETAHRERGIEEINLPLAPSLDTTGEKEALGREWQRFCTWAGFQPPSDRSAEEVMNESLNSIRETFKDAPTRRVEGQSRSHVVNRPKYTEETLDGFLKLHEGLRRLEAQQQGLQDLLDANSEYREQYETCLSLERASVAVHRQLALHQNDGQWIEAQYALLSSPAQEEPSTESSNPHVAAVEQARRGRIQELKVQVNSIRQQLSRISDDLAIAAERCWLDSQRYVAQKRLWEGEFKRALSNDTAKIWNMGQAPLLTTRDTSVTEPVNLEIDLAPKLLPRASDTAVREWVAAHSDRSVEEIDLELEAPVDVAAEEEALAQQWRLFCAWQELPHAANADAVAVQQSVIYQKAHALRAAAQQNWEPTALFPADTHAALGRYCELRELLGRIKTKGAEIQSLLGQHSEGKASYEQYRGTTRAIVALERELELYKSDTGWIEAQYARLSPSSSDSSREERPVLPPESQSPPKEIIRPKSFKGRRQPPGQLFVALAFVLAAAVVVVGFGVRRLWAARRVAGN